MAAAKPTGSFTRHGPVSRAATVANDATGPAPPDSAGPAVAAAPTRRGVGPGSHVALLGPTSRPFVTAIQAVWLAGGTVVVLPLPMRMSSLDDFVASTRTRVRAADTALLVADPMLAGFIQPEPGDPPVVLLGDLTGDASDPGA